MGHVQNYQPWNEEHERILLEEIEKGTTARAIGEMLGRSRPSVLRKIQSLKINNKLGRETRRAAPREAKPKEPTLRELRAESLARVKESALYPPVDRDLLAENAQLKIDKARLIEQLRWHTHSKVVESTGGLLTLRESDRHIGDENHLLGCVAALEEKAIVNIERQQPDFISFVGLDDWVAGTGIFPNQEQQSTLSNIEEQINVGAIKLKRFFEKIRKVTPAPIKVTALRGNHEYANRVSIGPYLFRECQATCLAANIKDISWVMSPDRALVNAASEGWYNILHFHGFGYSKISPNSQAFIDAAKDVILTMQRKLPLEQQPMRVTSGHTHWRSAGIERGGGILFDTCGGCQRNNRVKLGLNQRPIGWMIYISPKGMKDSICNPIEISPDVDTYTAEMQNPFLAAENKEDCADCLIEYSTLMKACGSLSDSDAYGVTKGSW